MPSHRTGHILGAGVGHTLSHQYAAGGASLSIETVTPAELNDIIGSTPLYLWRGNEASGAVEQVSGTYPLTTVGTPTKQYDSPELGAKCTRILSVAQGEKDMTGGCDGLPAAATGPYSGSLAILWIGYLETNTGGAYLWSNRYSSGNRNGAFTFTSAPTTSLSTDFDGGVTYDSRVISVNHNNSLQVIWLGRNSSEVWFHSSLGSSALGSTMAGSLCGAFMMGAGNVSGNFGGNSSWTPLQWGITAVWDGAGVDAFAGSSAERQAFADAFGYS